MLYDENGVQVKPGEMDQSEEESDVSSEEEFYGFQDAEAADPISVGPLESQEESNEATTKGEKLAEALVKKIMIKTIQKMEEEEEMRQAQID